MNASEMSLEIGRWFKAYRESYEWPLGAGRRVSEEDINCLCSDAHVAAAEGDKEVLHSVLVKIHRWKTQNRQGQTSKYCRTLQSLGMGYLNRLLGFGPFTDTQNLGILIDHLKVTNCNLPVCTAIASFLYGRKSVPILDRFLSQFFAREFRLNLVDGQTSQVLRYVKNIKFRIEDGGAGNLRLAVYTRSGFNYNLNVYLNEFTPECVRIGEELSGSGIGYTDIHGRCVELLPIDVEMAVFSWAIRHKNLF